MNQPVAIPTHRLEILDPVGTAVRTVPPVVDLPFLTTLRLTATPDPSLPGQLTASSDQLKPVTFCDILGSPKNGLDGSNRL